MEIKTPSPLPFPWTIGQEGEKDPIDPSDWAKMLIELMNPIDQAILVGQVELETWELSSRKKELAWYTFVPLTSSRFKTMLKEGKVYVLQSNKEEIDSKGKEENGENPWAPKLKELGYSLPTLTPDEVDNMEDGSEWADCIGITRMPIKGKKMREMVKRLQGAGMEITCFGDLHAESMQETLITKELVDNWLLCMGAKREKGAWVWSPTNYYKTKIQWNAIEKVWEMSDNEGDAKKTRLFYGLNGDIPTGNHMIFLLSLVYITSCKGYKVMSGRKAFLTGLFQDEVTVGFSHPILEQFIPRKLGCLQTGLSNSFKLELGESKDIYPVIRKYEALNYSVFVHKGGKYAVIQAEHTGFSRLPVIIEELVEEAQGDEPKLIELVRVAKAELSPNQFITFVGWLADKLPKYTGRALWLVPSAGLMGPGIESIQDKNLNKMRDLF